MNRCFLLFALVVSLSLMLGAGFAQAPANTPKADLLWPDGAPGALGSEDIDKPTLAPYLVPAGRGTGTAVIVCPGGGYQGLSMDKEGDQIANWLNSLGVTAFVLKYRLGPKYHHPVELGDAQRAIRTVRSKAAEYRVLPDRIGIMGFSAGGHLASTAGTHFDAGDAAAADPIDRSSSRPDFLVLCYPVISFTNLRAPGIEAQPAGRKCRPQAGGEPVERDAGDGADSADLPVPHHDRHHRAGGEQRAVLFGAAQGGRAGGTAHLRAGSARCRAGADRRSALQVAGAAGGLAARAGAVEFGCEVSKASKYAMFSSPPALC